jgi:putative FmdB family regulatory protein
MPIYEYQCKSCCHCFEYLSLSANDTAPACPQCACPDVEKLMSAGCFRASGIPKGSGGFDSKPACRPSG